MGAFQDKTGKTFGYLTIISKGEKKGKKNTWNAVCKCGEYVLNKRSDSFNEISMCPKCMLLYKKGVLLSPDGKIHPSIIDERGNTYGKLTVLELDTDLSLKEKGAHWICKCNCKENNPNIKVVSGHDLRSGMVQSCGCLHMKEEQLGTKYGMLTILERVKNSDAGKVRYKCSCECGNITEVCGSDLRSGRQISCGCIKSKGEQKIAEILKNNNISFEREVKFENCKDVHQLPFDFQIKDNDKYYLIEYDGKQHFGVEHAWSEFNYQNTHLHDTIKTQWCKDNNIPLIRIPYTHLENLCINDLLLETSKFICKDKEENNNEEKVYFN